MTRRRFTFWLSFGLFSLAEKLRVYGLDELAAAMMEAIPVAEPRPIHWRAAENGVWRWFERETFVDGKWALSGITTPINKSTGEAYAEKTGYLDVRLVPPHVRRAQIAETAEQLDERDEADAAVEDSVPESPGHPDESRRARHGRPPSKWLRSLEAEELRIWLKTIDVPEADVSGMTFWEHLTRDHLFDPLKIEGLEIEEQAKLHAAAHFGY